jgi:hypothetical protein
MPPIEAESSMEGGAPEGPPAWTHKRRLIGCNMYLIVRRRSIRIARYLIVAVALEAPENE